MNIQEIKDKRKISLLLKDNGVDYQLFDNIIINLNHIMMKNNATSSRKTDRSVYLRKITNAYVNGLDNVEVKCGNRVLKTGGVIEKQIECYNSLSIDLKRKSYKNTAICRFLPEILSLIDYIDIKFDRKEQNKITEGLIKIIYYFKTDEED